PYTVPAGTARSTPSTARVSPKVFTRPAVSIARPDVCVLMLRVLPRAGLRMDRPSRSRRLIAHAFGFPGNGPHDGAAWGRGAPWEWRERRHAWGPGGAPGQAAWRGRRARRGAAGQA